MAGAGARTRKDGSPSARVGSIERLAPRQIGPSMPTMREVRALGAAADAASGRKAGPGLAERAQSARAARTAFMAARRGEAERTRAGTLPARAVATQQALARANEAMKQARTAHHQARGVVAKRAAFAKYQAAEARRARLVQHRDRLLAAHEHRTGEDLHPGYKIGPNGAKHWTMERRKQPSEHEVKAAATRAEKTAAVNADFRQTAAAATAKHNTVIDAAQRAAREKAAAPKPARPAATSVKLDERNAFTKGKTYGVTHVPTGKGVPYVAGMLSKEKAERAAAGTKSGRTIDRLINGTQEQKMRASEALRRYAVQVHGLGHDTERHDYHRALAARKTKAAEAERVAKAEARRERREAPKAAKPMKDPAQMHPAEINKHLDAIDKRSSKNASAFIAAGRGHERPTDYQHKTDPLSREAHAIESQRAALRYEIQRRYGPGAPSRMPKGFKPLKNAFAEG